MEWEGLSRRKVLAGIASAGGIGAVVGQGTVALFSDEETFTNGGVNASEIVAGAVDLEVSLVETGAADIVIEISLPEEDDGKDTNNNPSHVWVQSKSCPSGPANDLKARLVLECAGSERTRVLESKKRLGDIVASLSEGILLSCDGNPNDRQNCLQPGDTRRLRVELTGDPSAELSTEKNFGLKFFAQQCRRNNPPPSEPPFERAGPDDCPSPPTALPSACQLPCLVDPCSDLSSPLAFDSSKLPPLLGDTGLSFVALCGPNGIDNSDVTLHVTGRNDDNEPTRVYWEVGDERSVTQTTWKFGNTIRKTEYPDGATSGIIVADSDVGQPGPGSPSDFCPSATSGIKYDGDEAATIEQKNAGDELPRFKQQLDGISGINLTDEVINRSELTEIRSVRGQDSTGDIDEDGTGIVGPTHGEDVIDAGGGSVTVQNYGVILGTVTNTGGNDVAIKTDGAVAGDIGVEATDENGNTLKGTGNVEVKTGATVVGDIVTNNTDGKNIKVKYGEQGDRSEVLGDARTSGGGSIEVVDYGRVAGTVRTDSGGNITVNTKSRVGGDAIAKGGASGDEQIRVGNSGPSQVCGRADTTGPGSGNIRLDGREQTETLDELPSEPAKVFGGVRSGGQVNLDSGAVSNGVVADSDVDVDNSKICGSVVCDGNVDVDDFCVIAEDEDADAIGIDTNNFDIVTDDGELGSDFENFGASTDRGAENQTIREGSIIAHKTIGGVQNSFVGGDVIARVGDIDVQSSVICGDVVAKDGAVDIDSDKTGPPKPIVPEAEFPDNVPFTLPREQDRIRSLIGGVVRVDGEDFDIAGATVFANGTTEPDERDDDVAVLVTQKASGGNDATITDNTNGPSILKGDVVVNGDLNVDIDGGSRVEGKVRANAGTVSLNNATIEGPDPNAVGDDTLIVGDGGKIDTLSGGTTVEGNVRVKSGGTLDVSGPATIEGTVCVEPGGTANLGSVTVEGKVKRNCPADGSSGGGSPTTPSSPSISCPIEEPSPNFPALDISPSVSSPTFSVPSSDCADLEFDQADLRDVASSKNFPQGSPKLIRSDLNSKRGINITKRVLSDSVAASRIEEIQGTPDSLVLGGSNPQARIGTTQNDDRAVIPGTVKLKNDSTVVGAIETDGSFKLKGSSAVAGDVEAATVETIKNSLLVGNLRTTTAGNTLSIESGSLLCGEVDAAGPIQIKQARVNGSVTAEGNIGEINESTVTGDVTTTGQGNVTIKSESLIDGNVDASGAISEVNSSEVSGPLEADGNISSVKQSEIGGGVRTTDGSNGTVTVEQSTVDGSIDADGAVSAVKSNSEIGGDVAAGGNISELKNSVVEGEVTTKSGSDGTITIEGAEIGGPVTADGKISAIKSNSAVGGDVTANGNISAIKGSQVDGNVRTTDGSGGTVKVKNSDIGGLIDADGNVEAIKSNSKINGDVTAGGTISELKNSDIGGNVTTTDGGDVTVEASTIVGGMNIDGTVSKIKASDVGGNVDATDIVALKGAQISGDVTVTDGSKSLAITRNNRKSVICGTVETSGRIEKIKNSAVTGSVRAAQVGKLKGEKTEVGGNVETTDPDAGLKIKGGSTVHGTVSAAGPIPEINSSTVEGNVAAGGKVKVKSSTVEGSIDANGRVEKIKSSDVGAVTAAGDVKIKGSDTGKVMTTSDSGGDLVLKSSSTVDGTIVLDGKVTKIKGSTVKGDVTASDEVQKIKDSRIEGTIDAGGDVLLKGSTTVTGDVIATGTVTEKSGVTVEGTVKENQ